MAVFFYEWTAWCVLLACLLATCMAVYESLKPVDKKWAFLGTRWRLPPGPDGQFVVGNLLQMFHARRAGRLSEYVSAETLSILYD